MATISITVPDAVDTRAMRAISSQGGYQEQVPDPNFVPTPENPGPAPMIDNPETRKQFVKKMILRFLQDNIRAYEANKAAEEARQTALTKADAEVALS